MKAQHKNATARIRRAAIGAAIGVVAATAGGLFLLRHHHRADAVAPATSLGAFRLGDQIHNKARLKMALEMGAGAPPQELALAGDWTATVTDIHDGVAEVACALAVATTSVRQPNGGAAAPPPEAEREMAAALSQSFFVSYRADGAATGVWFPREMNPSISSLLLAMASARQLVRPATAGDAWIVNERDVNGEYTAAYQQTGPGRFNKQKAAYLQAGRRDSTARMTGAVRGEEPKPSIKIDWSKTTLRADDAGRLLDVDHAEALAVDLGGMGMSFRMTAEVSLADGKIGQAPDMIGAFSRERSKLQFQPMEQLGPDSEAQTARRDRALLGGASYDELMVALSALPAQSKDNKNQVDGLSARLEAQFRLYPESATRAATALRSQTADHGKLLLDALLMARTPAAQAALGAVARDAAVSPGLRQYAILYIPRHDAPAEAAVAALRDMHGDPDVKLRRMAALGYGACGRKLRVGSTDRAERITRDLLARFDAEKDAGARGDLLVALGNTADRAALPVVRAAIDSEAPALRGQAIGALRYIADPSVDPLLMKLLQDKRDENVRLAAIGAIRYREVGAFTVVLADVAHADPDEGVRHAAVDLLGSQLRQLPALRAVLERARKDDPAKRIRELAGRHLAGNPPPG